MIDCSQVAVVIQSIEPAANAMVSVYMAPKPVYAPVVTILVPLDYLKKFGVPILSLSCGMQLMLTKQEVVLVVDELKLRLTYEEARP